MALQEVLWCGAASSQTQEVHTRVQSTDLRRFLCVLLFCSTSPERETKTNSIPPQPLRSERKLTIPTEKSGRGVTSGPPWDTRLWAVRKTTCSANSSGGHGQGHTKDGSSPFLSTFCGHRGE